MWEVKLTMLSKSILVMSGFIALDIAILLGLLRLLRSIFPGIPKARKARTTPNLMSEIGLHNKQTSSDR